MYVWYLAYDDTLITLLLEQGVCQHNERRLCSLLLLSRFFDVEQKTAFYCLCPICVANKQTKSKKHCGCLFPTSVAKHVFAALTINSETTQLLALRLKEMFKEETNYIWFVHLQEFFVYFVQQELNISYELAELYLECSSYWSSQSYLLRHIMLHKFSLEYHTIVFHVLFYVFVCSRNFASLWKHLLTVGYICYSLFVCYT